LLSHPDHFAKPARDVVPMLKAKYGHGGIHRGVLEGQRFGS